MSNRPNDPWHTIGPERDRVHGYVTHRRAYKRTFAHFNRKEEPVVVAEWEPDLRHGSIAVDLECLGDGE